jgi:site-specific DNA-methyltransferase (adenine-specific)
MDGLPRNEVIEGDCRRELAKLPADSIAACVADPPYNYEFIGKDWNRAEIERRLSRASEVGSSTLVKNIPYGSGLAGGVRNQRWYERNRDNVLAYAAWCEEWAIPLFRVMAPGAFVLVFNSTRTVAHVQVALEQAGFYTRDLLVWKRHSGIPRGLNAGRKLASMNDPDAAAWTGWHSALRNQWEAVLMVQRPLLNNYLQTVKATGVGLLNAERADGSFRSNIIDDHMARGSSEGHPTAKPVALVRDLISLVVPPRAEHVVLDPFAGSGTTLVAAQERGNAFLGIEIEPAYVRVARDRLESQSLGLLDSG